jgi:hypothetical protein
VSFKLRYTVWGIILVLAGLGNGKGIPLAYAVVGQAEDYDRFKWEDLKEFQNNLIRDESGMQPKPGEMVDMVQKLEEEKKSAQTPEDEEALQMQMEMLKAQLLHIPKPKRFGLEMSGDYKFETNSTRALPRQEKSDSTFNSDGTLRFDLSGRKTDLRFEVNGGKLWSVKFPLKDMWKAETRLRYRRKYFKRISHSSNWRIARTNTKTVDYDYDKVRWDGQIQQSMNYNFSPKLSLNLDTDYSRRVFLQQAFKKDGGWQSTFSPSGFWNFTPKSRISFGYNLGVSRNLRKEGDADSHNISLGYFGKITRKSSASVNVAYSRQVPLKQDSTTNTYTIGFGYVWQATGKSQIAMQLMRSLQNTTSTLTSGSPDSGDSTTVKQTTWFYNDSVSLTLNSRLTRKINATITSNLSWVRTEMSKDQKTAAEAESFDPTTQQLTFPQTVSLSYLLARWITLTFTYQFEYRMGDEHSDLYRNNAYTAAARISL